MINASKVYYLSSLERLMLRPLLVTSGKNTGVASEPTSPLPTPDVPSPGCLIACFLWICLILAWGLVPYFGGYGASFASPLSLSLLL
jgi:hypothetical protein